MKKILIALAATMVAYGAFAQGKVSQANDASRLFVFGPADKLLATDAALAGTGIPQTSTYQYALWGAPGTGVAESALLLVSPSTAVFKFSTTALPLGRLGGNSVTLPTSPSPGFPSATYASFQIRVWPASIADWATAITTKDVYVGKTDIFTMKPGGATPNPLNSTLASAGSTWAAGAIPVQLIPEPSTAALVGLGLSSLLIFRRRK